MKTQENIRFKFKSFDFKWLNLYVRNRFRWKIFRLKLESVDFKSFDFKGSTLYVRNRFRWKIFRLKLEYLLIGKWCDYPPPSGGCFLIVYVYDTIYGVAGVAGVRFVEFGGYVGVRTCLYP